MFITLKTIGFYHIFGLALLLLLLLSVLVAENEDNFWEKTNENGDDGDGDHYYYWTISAFVQTKPKTSKNKRKLIRPRSEHIKKCQTCLLVFWW